MICSQNSLFVLCLLHELELIEGAEEDGDHRGAGSIGEDRGLVVPPVTSDGNEAEDGAGEEACGSSVDHIISAADPCEGAAGEAEEGGPAGEGGGVSQGTLGCVGKDCGAAEATLD